jgi:hypothetical protein
MGVKLRRRKSGRLHTADFRGASQPIEDHHLDLLQPIQALEVLDLTEAKITDSGLEKLRSHRSMKLLNLTRCPVSAEAIRALRQHLIGCRIVT